MSKAIGTALRNSAWQSLGGLSVTALNFLLTLVYARTLGPAGFGALVTSQAQVLIWVLLVDLGLTAGLIAALTDAERDRFDVRALLTVTIAVRFVGAAIGALLSWGTAGVAAPVAQDVAYVPYLFAFACQQTAISYATFRGRQGTANACAFLGTAGSVAASTLLLYGGSSITTILFVQSLWGFAIAAMIALRLRGHAPWGERGSWATASRRLWDNSWPYGVVFAAMTVWNRADQIATTHWLGAEEGGQYGLATRLVAIPVLVAASVAFATFPDMQRIGRDAPEKLPLYAGTALKILARYGLPVAAIFLAAVALGIAPIVPKYRAALGLLPWFVVGVWAYWLHSFAINAFWGARRYREIVLAHVAALAVYLLALVPLVRGFGSRGAVLAYDLFGLVLVGAAVRFMRARGSLAPDFRFFGRFTPPEAELWETIQRKFTDKLRGSKAAL